MIRRQFLKLATITGATGLTSLGAFEAIEKKSKAATAHLPVKAVHWKVSGFTCVTCAVGLETLLRQQKGVVSATATYPQADVTIEFHPDLITENSLHSFIAELGFTAKSDGAPKRSGSQEPGASESGAQNQKG